ncbi:MAG: septum formation initiator family protein, partial [Akkermansiaceae bacterium]|nr:septum formation initiator family protein [Akkermansiaceae bacterium]
RIRTRFKLSKKKNSRSKASQQAGYNKVRARTERMNVSVRLAFCILVLMGCFAFVATTLQPYRKLKKMEVVLNEVVDKENAVIEQKDAKQRELTAILNEPQYLEMIARDRLNYYKPGERVFRIDRE